MAAPIAPSGAQVRSRLHRLAATLHTFAAQCPDELEPALAIAVAFVVDTEGDAIARDLAAMLGVSRPTATARWAGTQAYGLDELYAIAQAIGVPVGVLVALPTEQLAAA